MKHIKHTFQMKLSHLCKWMFKCLSILLFAALFVNVAICADQELESSSPKSSKPIPLQCSSNCETNYGAVLGYSPAGVPAYSNCSSECVIFEPHHLNEIYTGIKWQCVEYARRWLLQERGVVFGDVDIAADIWMMQEVNNPVTRQAYQFNSVANGASALPLKGDLLIYSKEYLGTGHVAVVVAVDEKKQTIQVAEQNYANAQWQNKHAREVSYVIRNDRVWLLDSYLVGWKQLVAEVH